MKLLSTPLDGVYGPLTFNWKEAEGSAGRRPLYLQFSIFFDRKKVAWKFAVSVLLELVLGTKSASERK